MTYKRALYLLLVCCTTALSVSAQASKDKAIAVVVHSTNPITNLSLNELRQVYLGDRKFWNRKTPIMVILHQAGAPETEVLLHSVVKMSDAEFAKQWESRVFRGEATAAPGVLFSNGMARASVSSIPGAIILISFKEVKGNGKIIKVDGFLPGQPGYPLHE